MGSSWSELELNSATFIGFPNIYYRPIMVFLAKLLLFMAVAQVSKCQVISDGPCPAYQLVQNFDVTRYLGKWHGYSKYPQQRFAKNNCSTVFYSDGTVPGGLPTVNVINRGFSNATGVYGRVVGTAVAPNPAVPAALIVSFRRQPSPASATPNYNVIGTDYDNFALVYNCKPLPGNTKRESLYILTRVRQPSQEVVDQALAGITSQGIDTSELVQNVQTNCPEVGPDADVSSNSQEVAAPKTYVQHVAAPYYYFYPQLQRFHIYR